MIPSRDAILKMLNDARAEQAKNESWVIHSLGVGNAAGKIAAALNEKGQNIDADKITKLGYLHDIGKIYDPWSLHPLNGYNHLRELGYDEEYCRVCLTHSFVSNDPFCMFSDFMQPGRDGFVIDYISKHNFNLEDNLILLCDRMFGTEMWTLDKRITDIISRHGVGSQTVECIHATFDIKKHVDELLGYNLYELFPEIKENL